jgi:hypothetical protein
MPMRNSFFFYQENNKDYIFFIKLNEISRKVYNKRNQRMVEFTISFFFYKSELLQLNFTASFPNWRLTSHIMCVTLSL